MKRINLRKRISCLFLSVVMVLTLLPATVLAADGDIDINDTNFPDANFRAWLTNSANIDGAGTDNVLTPEEIADITSIDVSYQSISDLTGIEYFTALTTLDCSVNNLTTLPPLPTGLTRLYCDSNSLTELPPLPAGLTTLTCGTNNLTELPALLPTGLTTLQCNNNNNLTELPPLPNSLTILSCAYNNLTALPVLPNGLTQLYCAYNNLTTLALKSSTAYTYIDVSYNKIGSTNNVTGKTITWDGSDFIFDPQIGPGDIAIDATNFPDANFRNWLTIDANIDGAGTDNVLTPAEVDAITSINVSYQSISDLTGIGYFTALTELNCNTNNLTALPPLPNSLTELNCGWNNLTVLPPLPAGLTELTCNVNSLTELPALLPTGLTELDCSGNSLTALPALLPSGLTVLHCGNNNLTELPALPAGLTALVCGINNLTELPALLPSGLTTLICNNNNLTELPALPAGLTNLNCGYNNLTELPSLPAGLTMLYCHYNNLTALELNSSAPYTHISVRYNNMASADAVTGAAITWGSGNFYFTPQKSPGDIVISKANFPDNNFREWLTDSANIGGAGSDYLLTPAEITAITSIDVYNKSISNLTGIGYFTALVELNCSFNSLTALPVLPAGLTRLYCAYNSLTTLALNSGAYTNIDVSYNNIGSEDDVTGNAIPWDDAFFVFAPQRTKVITFTATQAGGTSGTTNSTGIVLTFSETVTSLTADKITITGGTGTATKATLSGEDTIWTIGLSSVTTQGNVTVSIADFGDFHVTNNPQTVAVYKAAPSGGSNNDNGGSSTEPAPTPTPTPGPTPVQPSPTPTPTPAPTATLTENLGGTGGNLTLNIYENEEDNSLDITIDPPVDDILAAAGKATSKNPLELEIPTGSKEVIEYIHKSDAPQVKITLTIPDSLSSDENVNISNIGLSQELLEAAKETGKDITVAVADGNGRELYSWTFEGSNLAGSENELTEVNLALTVNAIEASELGELLSENLGEEAKGMIISFGHEGNLPSQAIVRIYVGDQAEVKPGDRIYLYHCNPETGKLETLPYSSRYTVDKDGYITVDILHCSDYVVLPKEATANQITSLRNQIKVRADKTKLTVGDNKNNTAKIIVQLPTTLELVENIKDKTSNPALGGVTVSFRSSDTKVVIVDEDGLITAKGKGASTVYATITLYSKKIKTVTLKYTVK